MVSENYDFHQIKKCFRSSKLFLHIVLKRRQTHTCTNIQRESFYFDKSDWIITVLHTQEALLLLAWRNAFVRLHSNPEKEMCQQSGRFLWIWINVSFARFTIKLPPSLLLAWLPPYLEAPALLRTFLAWSVLGGNKRHLSNNCSPTLMSSDSGISGTPKSISLQTPKTKCSKMMTKRSLRAKIYLVDVATRFSLIYLIWIVLKIEKGNFCKPMDRSEISLMVTESSATKKLVLCCFYLECTMFW